LYSIVTITIHLGDSTIVRDVWYDRDNRQYGASLEACSARQPAGQQQGQGQNVQTRAVIN